MKNPKGYLLSVIFGLALVTPATAFAALIDGSLLNVSGDALVSAVSIAWQCDQPTDTGCPVANHGDFSVTSSTGSFGQYNGTFGLIANINNAAQPLSTPFSLMNFMTFDLNDDLTIELNFIPLGDDPASTTCAGLQHCTPENALLATLANPQGLSAFNLDQQGVNTAAVFSVVGTVHEQGGATATLNGVFTAQFANMTPQQVLANLGSTNSTYSSNLSLVVTPEATPAVLFAAGLGLIGVGSMLRRRLRT